VRYVVMSTSKMLVVGLDGACWPLIEPWIEDGSLPNIKALRETGVWGDMKSSIPPITCPAWKCYSTGKNPGKLGVYWWENLDLAERRAVTPTSRSFKSPEIWDYLNSMGFTTGVVGMPMTYPPKRVDGFMVAGGPDCLDEGYSHPPDIARELEAEVGFKTNIPISSLYSEDGVEEALNLIEVQFKAAEHLYQKIPVDFLQVTTFHINGLLQHFYYDGEPVKRAWMAVDRWIGRLRGRFDYLLVMSDHGTSPMRKNWFLNAWLAREGYLTRRRTVFDLLHSMGVSREKVHAVLTALRIKKVLRRVKLLRHLSAQIPKESHEFGHHSGEATLRRVDLKKTRVIASPQGPLYINREVVKDDDEYERLRDELIEKIEGLVDPENGSKVVSKVYRWEEIYGERPIGPVPDLLVLDSDEYHNRGGIMSEEIFAESEWKGNNSLHGLFLLHGPGVRKGVRMEGVSIYDLAPTVLWIYGVRVPDDEMDGRVIREAFEEDYPFPPAHSISRTREEKLKVKKALDRIKKKGLKR